MDDYMRRAFDLAREVEGRVWPRPAVGAVVVRDGKVVGEGSSVANEGAHAEVVAIDRAGEMAQDADLYVTLEPCCHVGSQPACVDAIAASGIRRVFSTIEDPDPRVSGGGFARLADSGIQILRGSEPEALRLYEPFAHRIRTSLPFVTLKFGSSMDGRIAAASGDSKWITSPESRREVHQLRARVDAVMVGAATVMADDPHLGCRLEGSEERQPMKIVIDSSGRTSAASLMNDQRTIVVTSEHASRKFDDTEAQVVVCPTNHDGIDLSSAMKELAGLGLNWILCEGGPTLATNLLREKLVSRFLFYVAPVLLGSQALPMFGTFGAALESGQHFNVESVRSIGADFVVEGSCSQE